MPEKPEVQIIALKLNELFTNKLLIDIIWDISSVYKDGLPKYKELGLPLKLLKVYSRGKKVIFCLENQKYLISSLGMSGVWLLKKDQHSNLTLRFGKRRGSFNIVEETLYFDDQRHFGKLNVILNKEEYEAELAKLGPDLLQDQITKEEWYLRFRKRCRLQICNALLKQEIFSGIGNYLRADILYKAKIKPDRRISELTDEELEILRIKSIETIKESFEKGGYSIKDYRDPFGNEGKYQPIIYNQSKDPHGNKIVTNTFTDKRTIWWCPVIQK